MITNAGLTSEHGPHAVTEVTWELLQHISQKKKKWWDEAGCSGFGMPLRFPFSQEPFVCEGISSKENWSQ